MASLTSTNNDTTEESKNNIEEPEHKTSLSNKEISRCHEWNTWCDDPNNWSNNAFVLPKSQKNNTRPKSEISLCYWRNNFRTRDKNGKNYDRSEMKELLGDKNYDLFWKDVVAYGSLKKTKSEDVDEETADAIQSDIQSKANKSGERKEDVVQKDTPKLKLKFTGKKLKIQGERKEETETPKLKLKKHQASTNCSGACLRSQAMNIRRCEKMKQIKIKFINGMAKDLKGDLNRGWAKFHNLGGFGDLIKDHKLSVEKVKKKHNITDDELEDFSPIVIPINYIPDGNPYADIFDSKFLIFKMAEKEDTSPETEDVLETSVVEVVEDSERQEEVVVENEGETSVV